MRNSRMLLPLLSLLLLAANIQGRCHGPPDTQTTVEVNEEVENLGASQTTNVEIGESLESSEEDGYEVIAEWHNPAIGDHTHDEEEEGGHDDIVTSQIGGHDTDYVGVVDQDREDRCELLAHAVLQALAFVELQMGRHGANEMDADAMRESMISYVGLDLTDAAQVREFACRLVDAETVDDLAGVLHTPVEVMRNIYLSYRTQLAIIGGYDGLHVRMMLGLRLATALREFGGSETINPAQIRSQMTLDDLLGLLNALQEEFGPGFLVLLSWMPFDDSLLIRDMEAFATALLEFTDVESFSRETGIDVEYIHALHDNVHEIARLNLRPEGVDIYLGLIYAIEYSGLLDLQI